MTLFQGLFFLVLGIGILLVVYQSLSRGCCSNGFKGRLEFRMNEQPLMFWFLFVLYAVAGVVLTLSVLRLLTRNAIPLPLQ